MCSWKCDFTTWEDIPFNQIEMAKSMLQNIEQYIPQNGSSHVLSATSNQFNTFTPHAFGITFAKTFFKFRIFLKPFLIFDEVFVWYWPTIDVLDRIELRKEKFLLWKQINSLWYAENSVSSLVLLMRRARNPS